MALCERCGQSIDVNMINCPNCGLLIQKAINKMDSLNNNIINNNAPTNNLYQNINQNNNSNEVEFCSNCGNVLNTQMKNCIRCGAYNRLYNNNNIKYDTNDNGSNNMINNKEKM